VQHIKERKRFQRFHSLQTFNSRSVPVTIKSLDRHAVELLKLAKVVWGRQRARVAMLLMI